MKNEDIDPICDYFEKFPDFEDLMAVLVQHLIWDQIRKDNGKDFTDHYVHQILFSKEQKISSVKDLEIMNRLVHYFFAESNINAEVVLLSEKGAKQVHHLTHDIC